MANKIVLVRDTGEQVVVNGDKFTFINGEVSVYVESHENHTKVFGGIGFIEAYKYGVLCHNNAPSHHIRDLFLRLTQEEFEEMYSRALDAYFTANCSKCCHR